MLYDPKWNRPKEAKDATADQFLSWVERQPADATYNYDDCDGACLIDLFFGRKSSAAEYEVLAGIMFGKKRLGMIAADHPRTFGAAFERAVAARA